MRRYTRICFPTGFAFATATKVIVLAGRSCQAHGTTTERAFVLRSSMPLSPLPLLLGFWPWYLPGVCHGYEECCICGLSISSLLEPDQAGSEFRTVCFDIQYGLFLLSYLAHGGDAHVPKPKLEISRLPPNNIVNHRSEIGYPGHHIISFSADKKEVGVLRKLPLGPIHQSEGRRTSA